jgi:hypothetical protein
VSNTLFEPHIGDSIFKSMANDEKFLKVIFQFQIKKIIKNDSAIIGAEFSNLENDKNLIILSKRIIDATELGDVLNDAKIPYDIGMESNDITKEQVNFSGANDIIQDITYVGILKDYGKPQEIIPRPINYDSTEFDGSNIDFYHDTNRKRPNVDAKKMLQYGKLPNNKYMLNWPIYGNDIYLNVIEKTQPERDSILEQAKQQTLRFVYFIQKDLGFKNLALADDEFPTKDKLAFYPYHRESRRVHGLVRMTIHHLSTPFDTPQPLYTTGIAVGDYPVDHHHKKNFNAPQHLEFFPVPSFNIPLGVLIPANGENIIISEKSISVSNIVNGTTRLQPCVMQIGQASGILAALSIKENVAIKDIPIRKLQNILLDANGYIMPYKDVSQNDINFKPIQKIGATGLIRGKGASEGWTNSTYFQPNELVDLRIFLNKWNEKFKTPTLDIDQKYLTVKDALKLAAVLRKTTSEKIKDNFRQNWNKKGLSNFNLKRPILRYELAVILDCYNVFEIFDVNVYGFIKN